MHCMHKFSSTSFVKQKEIYKGLECLEVCNYDRKCIFRDFFSCKFSNHLNIRGILFFLFFPTNTFHTVIIIIFLFLFFFSSSCCYVDYIICASPFGLFLHTAVWVTHQKQDSRSSSQKETRKGLQHIEPINSTPLAVLTFGGVSQ